jgi:hypothetical protein
MFHILRDGGRGGRGGSPAEGMMWERNGGGGEGVEQMEEKMRKNLLEKLDSLKIGRTVLYSIVRYLLYLLETELLSI